MPRLPMASVEAMPETYAALDEFAPEAITDHVGISERWLNENPVLRTIGNNYDVADLHINAFLKLWGCTGLNWLETELVMVAMAAEKRSRMEWQSHVPRVLAAGCPKDAILGLPHDELEAFDDHLRALVRYVQAIVNEAVTDEIHDAVEEHYEAGTIIGISFLTTYYMGWTANMDALGFDVEDMDWGEWIGWDLANFDEEHPKYVPPID